MIKGITMCGWIMFEIEDLGFSNSHIFLYKHMIMKFNEITSGSRTKVTPKIMVHEPIRLWLGFYLNNKKI